MSVSHQQMFDMSYYNNKINSRVNVIQIFCFDINFPIQRVMCFAICAIRHIPCLFFNFKFILEQFIERWLADVKLFKAKSIV